MILFAAALLSLKDIDPADLSESRAQGQLLKEQICDKKDITGIYWVIGFSKMYNKSQSLLL